jgi:mRNA interferase MazF
MALMPDRAPQRGEIWDIDLGTPIGHEAAFLRPGFVVSADRFNVHGLVTVCPVGRTYKPHPTRVEIQPGSSGLDVVSYIQVEQLRTVSTDRLISRRGRAESAHLLAAERIVRMLLEIR